MEYRSDKGVLERELEGHASIAEYIASRLNLSRMCVPVLVMPEYMSTFSDLMKKRKFFD